uniref:Uncharacterized protein n=1 Tax=Yoonia rhodophyticola TaxID=3137370 RepID=A0AAN0MBT3_9RHOB
MTDGPTPRLQELVEKARYQAAIRESFAPAVLIQDISADASLDPVMMVDVLSALRADCTVDGPRWVMRPGVRRKVLGDVGPDPADKTAATPVEDALAGKGIFAPANLTPLITDPGDTDLQQIVATLDRAGPTAPAYGLLVGLRAALNTQSQSRRTDEILAKGFFGREVELGHAADWVATPSMHRPCGPGISRGCRASANPICWKRCCKLPGLRKNRCSSVLILTGSPLMC